MFSVLKTAVPVCAIALCLPQFAPAGIAVGGGGCGHVTDGTFTSPGEWATCPNAIKKEFTGPGGGPLSFLYVAQGTGQDNTLYLMYDYVASGPIAPANIPASFFDVFFEVIPDDHAYVVHIDGSGINGAFERPIGSIAPLNPDGSFLLPGDWSALSSDDLLLAKFRGAVGYGSSPDLPGPHLMAEFQLSISRPGGPAGGGAPGLYDPAPAFWGASEKTGGAGDPPLSSGIFSLNPDGTSVVIPVLGTNGQPLQQGNVPEPGAWMLFASGALALLGFRKVRATRSQE